ncbi:DUF192 domain-containing protein [Flavobacteriaceae bacterium F89]|uniref:DUF192 domain-containing protein n=1 Tax=Cerina litoralis TaxID=2874477 RepID=A0AAE3EU99_9FLAO|nr:DUF192 domain-containing protein [Cerina litoralis]MCG2459741.1 DUF192 domain-containing protein [Cerina litoralis]
MKRFKLFGFAILGFLILQTSCRDAPKKVIKTEPIAFKKEGELTIFSVGKDSVRVKLDIEIADSDYETQTGLMYRSSMEENQGMLFIFPNTAMHSFYMKNTEFPLDILFVDENLKIAHIAPNAKPFDETGISSQVPVKYVLEVDAGLSQKLGLKIGDSIEFNRL